MVLITIVTGAYKPTYNWGAPHCTCFFPETAKWCEEPRRVRERNRVFCHSDLPGFPMHVHFEQCWGYGQSALKTAYRQMKSGSFSFFKWVIPKDGLPP